MKALPIGVSDFKKIRENDYLYVDKSLLIKEIIDSGAEAILIPRPRRFGKTLNISMLKYFFEKTDQVNSGLFTDLQIWETGEKYTSKQGQYPVIFITFKDIKDLDWDSAYGKIQRLIVAEFDRHSYVKSCLSAVELDFFEGIVSRRAPRGTFEDSLKYLSGFLEKYHQKKVFIFIDEYDSLIEMGYIHKYYEQIIHFMRNLLSGCLKDNPALEKGILTGILRIAKESIFSGLNNLSVYSIFADKFGQGFGLLEDEVQMILRDYGLQEKVEEVRLWYNGYAFGGEKVYNPWSILKYVERSGDAIPYWVHSSSDEIIAKLITREDEIKEDLKELIEGGTVDKEIFENVVYQDLDRNPDYVWSILLFTGYLTYHQVKLEQGRMFCALKIPNVEIKYLYETIIMNWFRQSMSNREIGLLLDSLTKGRVEEFERIFQKFLLSSISYFDFGNEPERVYHAFVLGLLIYLNKEYEVKSNRESGFGRYDLLLIPRMPDNLAIVFEFKAVAGGESLEITADKALQQIAVNGYYQEIEERGIDEVLQIGVAFKGKKVLIRSRRTSSK